MSWIYEAYVVFLVAKGNLVEANDVYQLGISRNAEPIDRLKKMHALFLEQMTAVIQDPTPEPEGYHRSSKVYSGKVSLNSLQNSSRNKVIKLGVTAPFILQSTVEGPPTKFVWGVNSTQLPALD